MNVDLTRAVWRKARRSQANGSCVEVAGVDRLVAIRDSKAPSIGVLIVNQGEWSAFAANVPTR